MITPEPTPPPSDAALAPLEMVGLADAGYCEDGVCYVPGEHGEKAEN